MRIALLSDRIPPESPGGAGKIAWLMACGLRDAGHDVHVIAATEGPAFEEMREGVPTYHVHSRQPARWRAYWSLRNSQTVGPVRELLARIKPDVVNAHNAHNALSYHCLTAAHRAGFPVVLTAHDVMSFAYAKLDHFIDPQTCGVTSPDAYRLPPLYNLRQMRLRYNPFRSAAIRRVIARHTQARTCVSEALRQALEANGLPSFEVVHNGLNAGDFDASDAVVESLHERLGLAGRRVILFGGRVTQAKGSDQLLAVLNRVVVRVPETVLLILSRHALPQAVLDRPEHENLNTDNVRSGGWLSGEELAAAYHLADLVAVPSIYLDPFPTLNLEAMAAHKPVVATCYGGSPEAVADGETGYVVNPFDTDVFAARLESLLTDAALRERMGQAGYVRLQAQFTLTAQVQRMEQVYARAISVL